MDKINLDPASLWIAIIYIYIFFFSKYAMDEITSILNCSQQLLLLVFKTESELVRNN